MPKLFITRGISGSGKSTWARSQAGAVVVSRDDLRKAHFGSDGPEYYEVPKEVLRAREDMISVFEQATVRAALLAGYDVVSDNTHTLPKYLDRIAKVGYQCGADVEVKVFDIPLDHAIQRVNIRGARGGRDVPEDAMRRQHDQLAGTKDYVPTPPPEVKPYSGTPGKPKAIMFDVDGTLFHMGDKRNPYDLNVDVDDVDPVVAELLWAVYNEGYKVIIMSGRKEKTRKLTEEAFGREGIPFDHMYMRADDDDRSDDIVKIELFDNFVRDHYDVKFVVDDRNKVVAAWRRMGLKCFQAEDGDF